MRLRKIACIARFAGLGAMTLLLFACTLGESLPEATPIATLAEASDWYTLYFTEPDSEAARSNQGGPADVLVFAIEQAQTSVEMAIYDLNIERMASALMKAKKRGLAVRLVIESDNLDEPQFQELKEAGIEILGDRREGLMHNKFAILDHQQVCTGSLNYTSSDAYRNNNNLICIRSQRLAEDYLTEFNEMFDDDRFGPDSVRQTPYTSVIIDETLIEVLFSPDDGTAARLVELLRGARESIYFLAYSFTADDLAKAILERAQAGVMVAGVLDEAQVQANVGGEYATFHNAGLIVRLDGNPRSMHHKVIIIDGKIVVTGSYNFSRSAEEKNDENTLIIHNTEIAAQYKIEFDRIFIQGHD